MDLTREERKIEGEREGREGEMRNRKREGEREREVRGEIKQK
jgi:hypothetical protein